MQVDSSSNKHQLHLLKRSIQGKDMQSTEGVQFNGKNS